MASARYIGTLDDRRDPRFATRLAAQLLMYRSREEIMVEDVSSSGALVRGEHVPDKGTEVVLAAAGQQLVATVAWVRDDVCGLMFHRAIDAGTLRRLRAA